MISRSVAVDSFKAALACVLALATALPAYAQNAGESGAETSRNDGQVNNSAQNNRSGVRTLGTTITGNQEQPKVLYIVPWKSAHKDAAVPYRPVSGETDAIFRHVERQEHRRQLDFLEDFGADAAQ